MVIGNTVTHASETATLLQQNGWQIADIYDWESNPNCPDLAQSDAPEFPIDQSALFAGRHHGNLQDSRDYLDWEEELPDQIDQLLHQKWLELLGKNTN